jgi:hypothetical protein
MKAIRWTLYVLFLLLGVPAFSECARSIVSTVFYARHSLWHSIVGLGPFFIAHLVAAILGVFLATLIAPSKRRVAAWIAAVVVVVAASWEFVWFTYITAILAALIGSAATLILVYRKWPNQRPERNAGAASASTSTPQTGVAHP